MGSRANYVIIREGKVCAYYDHWGADGALDSVLDGPHECARMAAGCGGVDELMDWAYCEGGYLLDFDRKQALFYGYGDISLDQLDSLGDEEEGESEGSSGLSPALRQAKKKWSGWKLRYADNGVDDFSSYLETAKLTGQVKTQPRRSLQRAQPSAQPARRHGKKKQKR